jgi:hypothetical protein
MRSEIKQLLLFLLVASLLQACGGGGGGGDDGAPNTIGDGSDITSTSQDYSGETAEATLTSDNSQELATAAASGTKQAVSSESVPVVAARGSTAAREVNLTSSLCNTGSIIATYPDTGSTGSWRIDYDQCTHSASHGGNTYSTTYNGSVEGSYTQVGNGFRYEYRYENFTVTVQGPTGNHSQTFNMSMTCATNDNGTDYSCDYYSDYTGYDSRIYRVSDVDVSGNDSSGYNVSVRVYDPDHGYVTVTTEVPVTYGCSSGYPNAGRIQVEGADATVVTVEFTSCNTYVVVFDGVANTYNWP